MDMIRGMMGELGEGYEWGVWTVVCGIGVMDMIRGMMGELGEMGMSGVKGREESDLETWEAYRWNERGAVKQREPMGDWVVWLLMAGRGFGKTRAGG